MRRSRAKTSAEIAKEWDCVARIRADQIRHGRDLSYVHVLKPCILRLCRGARLDSVIDIGCGIGTLSVELAHRASRVLGVDISNESIRLAREAALGLQNVTFQKISVESLENTLPPRTFTLAVGNMSFSAITRLPAALRGISSVLMRGSHLIFTIPHPWFWACYAGFNQAKWFKYSEEIPIEWEFKISLEKTTARTTFIHRSLERYCSAVAGAGFVIEAIVEPIPSADVEALYPTKWAGPRFLGIRCRKS